LAANVTLISFHVAYLVMFIGQCAIIGAGVAGFVLQAGNHHLGLLAKPYYFVLTNLASLIAALRFLRGERMVVWTPVR
jgi:hypothetical protein